MPDKAMKGKLTGPQYSYSWANEVCAGDNEERAVVISSMNGFQYAVAAWLPIVIFPQTMAPDFRKLYSPACPSLKLLLTHALQDTDSRPPSASSSHRLLASLLFSFSCCGIEGSINRLQAQQTEALEAAHRVWSSPASSVEYLALSARQRSHFL